MKQKSFRDSAPDSIAEGRYTRCYETTSTTVKTSSRNEREPVLITAQKTYSNGVIISTE